VTLLDVEAGVDSLVSVSAFDDVVVEEDVLLSVVTSFVVSSLKETENVTFSFGGASSAVDMETLFS
jgi:hypothetical protein